MVKGFKFMRVRAFTIAALCVCLSACTHQTIDDRLTPLKGEAILTAIQQLGPVAWQEQGDGGVVYVWQFDQDVMIPMNGIGAPLTSTGIRTPQFYEYDYGCRLWIQADAFDVIQSWTYAERGGGCNVLAEKLNG